MVEIDRRRGLRNLGRLLFGTSGWSYQEWVGVFYPTASESKLRHYTRVFPTAEIDSTFYAFPQKGTVIGWDRYSPKGFVFNAKLPQTITHEQLADLGPGIEAELDKFAELMQPLNNSGKLGCLLIQLPPSYKFNASHLENFLALLPHGYRYAVEFRHKTWMQETTWQILSKYNAAYTIVDEPLLPPEIQVTADFAYLRWHGRGQRPWYDYHYKDEELESWLPKVKEVESSAKTVYGYFNNHFHGYAVENCLKILKMLGNLTSEQEEALSRAQSHLGGVKDKTSGLGKWLQDKDTRSEVVRSLASLMGESRLARALEIPDHEVEILDASNKKVGAKIRGYNVIMELPSRTILHDCGDWERSMENRQLCKHIGRVLLTIPTEIAAEWVSGLQSNLDAWKFGKPEKARI